MSSTGIENKSCVVHKGKVPAEDLRVQLLNESRNSHCTSITLRAGGGFGPTKPQKESTSAKDGSSSNKASTPPNGKVSGDEKAADPQKALSTDLDEMRKIMGSDDSNFGQTTLKDFGDTSMEASAPEKQISRNPGGKRAEPVNMDAGAVFDKDFLKNSFETVTSDEWRKKDKMKLNYDKCRECGGTGRLAGGLSTLPGFDWWPIKAYRPCPTCEREGRTYERVGQGLNEVLFGVDDMPANYQRPKDLGGMSPEDIKKIMSKGNRAERRKAQSDQKSEEDK